MAELIRIVDVTLPKCANTFGVAPCTATGPAGSECYNTLNTCQDKPNYDESDTFVVRFSDNDEYDSIPALTGLSVTAQQYNYAALDPDNSSLGRRSVLKASFKDFEYGDKALDPYLSTRTYTPRDQGTFFGKLVNRFLYYRKIKLTVYRGVLGDAVGSMIRQDFLVTRQKGPDDVPFTCEEVTDVLHVLPCRSITKPFRMSCVQKADNEGTFNVSQLLGRSWAGRGDMQELRLSHVTQEGHKTP